MSANLEVFVFANANQLSRAGAQKFVEYSQTVLATEARFSVALSGGTTPRELYRLLSKEQCSALVDWERVHIFFVDERCVPPDHPDSNYGMIRQTLLDHVPIPAANVHPMNGAIDPNTSAQIYETELRTFFQGQDWPVFDFVLLGLGADGHTASLFPETAALKEEGAWVVANWVPKLNASRITLTLPTLNQAARLLFLVSGAGKAEAVAKVLGKAELDQPLPAKGVKPKNGLLEWFLDDEAAALWLQQKRSG